MLPVAEFDTVFITENVNTIVDGRDDAPTYHGPTTPDTLLEVIILLWTKFTIFSCVERW